MIPLLKNTRGFTLLEVMVSLIIGTVIAGGVMGLISVSLQYTKRVSDRSAIQPVLEAAAQEVLAHPEKVRDGNVVLEQFSDKPQVQILAAPVEDPDDGPLGNKSGQLFRIQLGYGGQILELSLLVPKERSQF